MSLPGHGPVLSPLPARWHARQGSQNLTVSTVEYLGRAIVTGQFRKDSSLPNEKELCAQLSISRSVLREAVRILAAKGLLDARPRCGTRVQPQSHWSLLDRQVLLAAEPSIFHRAAD